MKRAIIALSLLVASAVAFPTGAPPEACSTRTPQHGVDAQTTTCPYDFVALGWIPGEFTNMGIFPTVEGSDIEFKGFLASVYHNGAAIGEMKPGRASDNDPPSSRLKLACDNTSLTHSDRNPKREIFFQWKAPLDLPQNTEVTLRLTIVQEQAVFWVDCSIVQLGSLISNPVSSTTTSGTVTPEENTGDPITSSSTSSSSTSTTTAAPTAAPATRAPQTPPPTTRAPTTQPPTTRAPTTQPPTTRAPTTQPPTTRAPRTQPSTTRAPRTQPPTTRAPRTQPPTTRTPRTRPPTTRTPRTRPPTTRTPRTRPPTTRTPRTRPPTTRAPRTRPPTTRTSRTRPPTTRTPRTRPPTTRTPRTRPPTTRTPRTRSPTTRRAPRTRPPTTRAPAPHTYAPRTRPPATRAPTTRRPRVPASANTDDSFDSYLDYQNKAKLNHESMSASVCKEYGNEFTIVPNSSCRQFVQKIAGKNSANYRGYTMKCPGGTRFDPRVCSCAFTTYCPLP